MRDVVLLKLSDPEAAERLVDETIAIIRAVAPDGDALTIERWVHAPTGLALIQTVAPGAPEPAPLFAGDTRALGYTGYVTDEANAPGDIAKLLEIAGGRLRMRRSPGGIAAYFVADAEYRKAYAWSSHGGVQGVFFTEGEHGTAISNRPLLSHLVARQTRTPAMCATWARRVLVSGSTVWNDTPFEGTRYIEPRSMLVVSVRGVAHQAHPLPLPGRRYVERSEEGIDAFVDATCRAVSVLRRLPPCEFRLSGGKDSRLLAAAIAHCGIDAEAATYSPRDGHEGPYAAQVSELLGLRHRFPLRGVAQGDALLPMVQRNLRRSDGLLGENRQLAFFPVDLEPGRPEVEGHAHHPRGGFSRRMLKRYDDVVERLLDTGLGDQAWVVPELVEERRERLLDLFAGYTCEHATDLGYWMYNDWQMTRWIQGAHMTAGKARPVVWPLMDDAVLEVCAQLSAFDRVSEYTVFAATQRMAPGIERIPLFNSKWRFDGGSVDDSPFPEGFEQRNRPLPQKQAKGKPSAEKTIGIIAPLFREVMSTPAAEPIRTAIAPHALSALMAEGDAWASLGERFIRVNSFMWKATALGLVLGGRWVDA